LGLGRDKKYRRLTSATSGHADGKRTAFLPPAFDLNLEPSEEIRGVIACDQLVVLAIDDAAVAALGD
jgi:hypothetical protein